MYFCTRDSNEPSSRATQKRQLYIARNLENQNDILASWQEHQALPDSEWRKDYYFPDTGGFVATHIFKARDDMGIPGIAAEVMACFRLATMGKHVLRLPENIPELIDNITIDGKTYNQLLKFKTGESNPRGYPDVYFDGQTWDFKTSTFANEDTLRHRIREGRKADNVILITQEARNIDRIQNAVKSEYGMRKKDCSWKELPNVFCLYMGYLTAIWEK